MSKKEISLKIQAAAGKLLRQLIATNELDDEAQEAIHDLYNAAEELLTPPPINVVDDTHVEFDGHMFKLSKERNYVRAERLHVAVVEFRRGEAVPQGYDVHHGKKGKFANTIDNLVEIPHDEHLELHKRQRQRVQVACAVCGKTYTVTINESNKCKKHYCSEACRYKAKKICPICGKEFDSSNRTRYGKVSEICRSCAAKEAQARHTADERSNAAMKTWETRRKRGTASNASGVRNAMASLTAEQVHYIRENYKPRDKEFGATALAEKFGVRRGTIRLAFQRQTYKDVE